MVSPKIDPKACWEFESEVLVLHHPTTISVRYQAMGMVIIVETTTKITNQLTFFLVLSWQNIDTNVGSTIKKFYRLENWFKKFYCLSIIMLPLVLLAIKKSLCLSIQIFLFQWMD